MAITSTTSKTRTAAKYLFIMLMIAVFVASIAHTALAEDGYEKQTDESASHASEQAREAAKQEAERSRERAQEESEREEEREEQEDKEREEQEAKWDLSDDFDREDEREDEREHPRTNTTAHPPANSTYEYPEFNYSDFNLSQYEYAWEENLLFEETAPDKVATITTSNADEAKIAAARRQAALLKRQAIEAELTRSNQHLAELETQKALANAAAEAADTPAPAPTKPSATIREPFLVRLLAWFGIH